MLNLRFRFRDRKTNQLIDHKTSGNKVGYMINEFGKIYVVKRDLCFVNAVDVEIGINCEDDGGRMLYLNDVISWHGEYWQITHPNDGIGFYIENSRSKQSLGEIYDLGIFYADIITYIGDIYSMPNWDKEN